MQYFVTTFSNLGKSDLGYWDLGSVRTVGFFNSLDDARETVINNHGDICETIYDYAVIEGVGEGLYPLLEYQELFKVVSPTITEDGKEYYNSSLKYEPITTPEGFKKSPVSIG